MHTFSDSWICSCADVDSITEEAFWYSLGHIERFLSLSFFVHHFPTPLACKETSRFSGRLFNNGIVVHVICGVGSKLSFSRICSCFKNSLFTVFLVKNRARRKTAVEQNKPAFFLFRSSVQSIFDCQSNRPQDKSPWTSRPQYNWTLTSAESLLDAEECLGPNTVDECWCCHVSSNSVN